MLIAKHIMHTGAMSSYMEGAPKVMYCGAPSDVVFARSKEPEGGWDEALIAEIKQEHVDKLTAFYSGATHV